MMSNQDNITAPPVTWRDYLLCPFFIASILLVLVVFDLIQRLALLRGRKYHELAIDGLNSWFVRVLRWYGVKIEFQQQHELVPGRPYIIVSNHQSLFDIPILYVALAKHRLKYIAKKELSRWIPSVSYNLRHGGNVLIDRGNPKQSIQAITQIGANLTSQGLSVVIFPEGTRARNGVLKHFRPAGLATLLQSAPLAQIVPVAIDGSWKLAWRKGFPVPLRTKITVMIGAPIQQVETQSLKELSQKLHDIVAGFLEQIRSQT